MFIKIGNNIFDSSKQIITILISNEEKQSISEMGFTDDIFQVYPTNTHPLKVESERRTLVSKLMPAAPKAPVKITDNDSVQSPELNSGFEELTLDAAGAGKPVEDFQINPETTDIIMPSDPIQENPHSK